MPPVATRRRITGRSLELTPEAELDARLDRKPADLVAALEAADATLGKLYAFRVRWAVRDWAESRSLEHAGARAYRREQALSYIRIAQRMRAKR